MAPPSFFVLIFGDKNTPELQVEPLSKHFTENAPENSVELVVNVYNICYSEDNLYNSCDNIQNAYKCVFFNAFRRKHNG